VELVVVNFRAAGKARRTTFNGRDYLVAPMTLIVPGVVPGSEGPLLYPLEELARNYQAWNYMPIVVNHPLRNGRHVSAREPAILEESGVGFVFNASLDGRLRGEGWFDVERTRRVDGRVLDRLERGEPLELSTGLYVDEEAAPLGAVWNTPGGPRPYRAVARNYRPDHLAVLPDQRGACAVDDGCGVLVNAGKDQPVDVGGEDWGSYSRQEILDLLTEAALESLDGPAGNAFNPNQPRDERGRFAGGGGVSGGEKQLHEMTRAEFVKANPPPRYGDWRDDPGTKVQERHLRDLRARHMVRVMDAIEAGKHVPAHVLIDYPELKPAAPAWEGGMAHGARSEARAASAAHVREFVTKGGPATHAEVGALADHLARLTVAQLHDLRKEHGLPAQGAWKQRKPELVQTLAGRLAAHRNTLPTAAARELTAAVKGNPDFVESKNRPSDAVHAYTHEGTGFRATAHPDGRFHVWDTGLSHQATHHPAAEAVAHAASPPAKGSPDYHQRTADVETAARQQAVADATARRTGIAQSDDSARHQHALEKLAPDPNSLLRRSATTHKVAEIYARTTDKAEALQQVRQLRSYQSGNKETKEALRSYVDQLYVPVASRAAPGAGAGHEGTTKATDYTRVEVGHKDSAIDVARKFKQIKDQAAQNPADAQRNAKEFLDDLQSRRGQSYLRQLALDHSVQTGVNPGGKGTDLAHPNAIRDRLLAKLFTSEGLHEAAKMGASIPAANARGDQPRVPAGQPGGGRFASVAEAGAAVEKASARVKGAQAALEKAKAALKVEKDGLVTARAGLKEAQAREKAQSPRAKAAAAKAKEKAPVDVGGHVKATKALSDEGIAGKEVVRARGNREFQPKLSNEEFTTKLDAHVAGMNKTLNKAQVLGVAAALGFPRSTTKKAALEVVRHTILQRRGTRMRSYV
jgi:hypothetical protein